MIYIRLIIWLIKQENLPVKPVKTHLVHIEVRFSILAYDFVLEHTFVEYIHAFVKIIILQM